jgi:hypothetical protein
MRTARLESVLEFLTPDVSGVKEAKVVKVLVIPAGAVSRNNRVYTEESKKKWVAEIQSRLDQGIQVPNFLSHPDMLSAEFGAAFDYRQNPVVSETVSIWYDNGDVWSTARFLPTAEGRRLARAAGAGDKPAVSLRAAASCSGPNQTGVCELGTGDGWDWLQSDEMPGFAGAGLAAIIESKPACACQQHTAAEGLDIPASPGKVEPPRIGDSMNKALLEALFRQGMPWATAKETLIAAGVTMSDIPAYETAFVEMCGPDKKKDEEAPGGKGAMESAGHQNRPIIIQLAAPPAPVPVQPATPVVATMENFPPEIQRLVESQRLNANREAIADYVRTVLAKPVFESFTLTDHSKFPPGDIIKLADHIASQGCTTEAEANGMIRMGLKAVAENAEQRKAQAAAPSPSGHIGPSVEVGCDKSYMEYVDKVCEAASDYRRQNLPEQYVLEKEFKASSKAGVEATLEVYHRTKGRELAEQARYQRTRAHNDRAIESTQLIGDGDFLNRDIVLTAINTQMWWQMMSARLTSQPGPASMKLDAPSNLGRFVSIQSQIYKGGNDGNPNFFVRPQDPLPEVKSETAWQQYMARYQGLAFRIADEDIKFLTKGPLNIDVAGRMSAEASAALARRNDKRVHEHMLTKSDAYRGLAVVSETTASGSATHYTYSAGGGITYQGKTYGANVCGAVWLRRGAATNATVALGPVVRPEEVWTNWTGTPQSSVLNPIVIDDINSIAQVMGYLDDDNQIQPLYSGESPTFALDPDRGVVVFKIAATSGFDGQAGNMPVMDYVTVRNVTRYDQSLGSATRGERADELIAAIADLATEIKKYRYTYPDFCLFPELIGGKLVPHAEAFKPLERLEWAMLNTGFGPEIALGMVSSVNLLKTETPLPGAELRALMGQMGYTMFVPIEPLSLEGPVTGAITQTESGTAKMRLTSERLWSLREINLLATPTVIDQDNLIYNFPSTSFFFTGTTPGYTLGIS